MLGLKIINNEKKKSGKTAAKAFEPHFELPSTVVLAPNPTADVTVPSRARTVTTPTMIRPATTHRATSNEGTKLSGASKRKGIAPKALPASIAPAPPSSNTMSHAMTIRTTPVKNTVQVKVREFRIVSIDQL